MKYVTGEPGSVVRFDDGHPNPRLRGLELFLFRSREQFKEVYGRYFDLEVGLDEFDLYPVFMSWYYVIGKKKGNGRSKSLVSSQTPDPSFREANRSKDKPPAAAIIEESNVLLWDKKYKSMYGKNALAGAKYPNEYFIRFLATRERGSLGSFYKNIGREDDIIREGEKVLELLPANAVNLLMAAEMGYSARGLSCSDIVVEKSREAMKISGRAERVHMDVMKKGHFPYAEDTFQCVISEKAGSYMPDQKRLVEETARVMKKGGETFIGYLSPRHGYMKWAEPAGGGYYRVSASHPDPTMHGMVIYVAEKEDLRRSWSGPFNAEIKTVEFDLHRYFSSFYFVKAKKI